MSGIGVQDVKFPKKSIKVMLKIHAMAYGLAKRGIKYQYMGENHRREMNTVSLEMEEVGN